MNLPTLFPGHIRSGIQMGALSKNMPSWVAIEVKLNMAAEPILQKIVLS